MRLERTRASEALVANFALVLLLRARRNLGAELAHHGLGRRRNLGTHQALGSWQGSRVDGLNVRPSGRII